MLFSLFDGLGITKGLGLVLGRRGLRRSNGTPAAGAESAAWFDSELAVVSGSGRELF